MLRALGLWLGLTGVYVLAVLAGGADAAPPLPWAIDRLRGALGEFGLQALGAALTALAFTTAAATARRVTGDPWATGATLLVALSPPALALATRIGPDPFAAALLAGGIALTARCRTDPRRAEAVGAAVLLAVVPWFGMGHAVAVGVALVALVRWTMRRGRPVVALICAEACLASGVSLYEVGLPAGPAAAPGGGALPLLGVLLDRGDGVLRWAPVLVLVLVGAFALWRSLRDGVARLVPDRAEVEATGLLTGGVLLATVITSAFAAAAPLVALPIAAPLAAWGLRRASRAAVLPALLTAGASAWAAVALLTGDAAGWTGPGLRAPWGPLDSAFPDVAAGGWWPVTLGVALLVALIALAVWEWRAREATLSAAARGR